jgi:hypothetical protein
MFQISVLLITKISNGSVNFLDGQLDIILCESKVNHF